jgi:hypothetical protein
VFAFAPGRQRIIHYLPLHRIIRAGAYKLSLCRRCEWSDFSQSLRLGQVAIKVWGSGSERSSVAMLRSMAGMVGLDSGS